MDMFDEESGGRTDIPGETECILQYYIPGGFLKETNRAKNTLFPLLQDFQNLREGTRRERRKVCEREIVVFSIRAIEIIVFP